MKRYVFLLCALLATGCGGHPTGTVSGKVTLNGEALSGATITFVSTEHPELLPVTVPVDEAGNYTATGVPYGDLLVGLAISSVEVVEPDGTVKRMSPIEAATRGKEAMRNVAPVAEGDRTGPSPPPVVYANPSRRLDLKYAEPISSGLTFNLDQPTATYNVDVK